jgi:hypothetical protein
LWARLSSPSSRLPRCLSSLLIISSLFSNTSCETQHDGQRSYVRSEVDVGCTTSDDGRTGMIVRPNTASRIRKDKGASIRKLDLPIFALTVNCKVLGYMTMLKDENQANILFGGTKPPAYCKFYGVLSRARATHTSHIEFPRRRWAVIGRFLWMVVCIANARGFSYQIYSCFSQTYL